MDSMMNYFLHQPSKSWNRISDELQLELSIPHGMLGQEERNCLYWLGSKIYRGDGLIIDAGSYVGSSAFCLARGLEDSRAFNSKSTHAVIHAYDYFSAYDQYVIDSISTEIRPINYGESYLDIFHNQTYKYRGLIEDHPGDFLLQTALNDPVEILFIDIAKNDALNSHVIDQFFPRLIPGHSMVMHQDYYHVWHPAIHVTMQFLGKYFEIIDPHIEYQSRLYKLKQPFDPADLKIAVDYQFSLSERIDLLQAASDSSEGAIKKMLNLIIILEFINAGDFSMFSRLSRDFEIDNPDLHSSHELWAVQCKSLNNYARTKFNLYKFSRGE